MPKEPYPVYLYVAGPYCDPRGEHYVLENILKAREIAAWCWSVGIPTVCPHLMGGAAPDAFFLKGDLILLARCDAILMLPNWEISQGARAEKQRAEFLGIPVFTFPHGQRRLIYWAQMQVVK
jgi:hypothetical protein